MTQAELESLDLAEVDSTLEGTPLLSNTSPEVRPHSWSQYQTRRCQSFF